MCLPVDHRWAWTPANGMTQIIFVNDSHLSMLKAPSFTRALFLFPFLNFSFSISNVQACSNIPTVLLRQHLLMLSNLFQNKSWCRILLTMTRWWVIPNSSFSLCLCVSLVIIFKDCQDAKTLESGCHLQPCVFWWQPHWCPHQLFCFFTQVKISSSSMHSCFLLAEEGTCSSCFSGQNKLKEVMVCFGQPLFVLIKLFLCLTTKNLWQVGEFWTHAKMTWNDVIKKIGCQRHCWIEFGSLFLGWVPWELNF